ncbi:hypothetical protein AHF37_04094 [Paragonimus kellicotti]|nr:hypothetical protein AHF37_04094 [Paragonimus kellicotti]
MRKSSWNKTSRKVNGEGLTRGAPGSDNEGSTSSEHQFSGEEEYDEVPSKRRRPPKSGNKIKKPRKHQVVMTGLNLGDDKGIQQNTSPAH